MSDYEIGYKIGFFNGQIDDDVVPKDLSEEGLKGYVDGFAEGWKDVFGTSK